MQPVRTLRQFAKMTAAYDKPYFFTTSENPTHVSCKNMESRPKSWEAFAYEQTDDNEEKLGLSRGTYLICFDFDADMAMFYRVSGPEGVRGETTALKTSLTMLDRAEQTINKLDAKLEEKDGTILALASKLEKKDRKLKKAKQRLADNSGEITKDIVETILEKLVEILDIKVDRGSRRATEPGVVVTEVHEEDR